MFINALYKLLLKRVIMLQSYRQTIPGKSEQFKLDKMLTF